MRFRHTRAKKNPIARWQGRLAKWKVASLFSARDDLWLRFESWPTRTQLQSHKAGGALPLPLRGRHRRRQIPVARFEGAFAEGISHERDMDGRLYWSAPFARPRPPFRRQSRFLCRSSRSASSGTAGTRMMVLHMAATRTATVARSRGITRAAGCRRRRAQLTATLYGLA